MSGNTTYIIDNAYEAPAINKRKSTNITGINKIYTVIFALYNISTNIKGINPSIVFINAVQTLDSTNSSLGSFVLNKKSLLSFKHVKEVEVAVLKHSNNKNPAK